MPSSVSGPEHSKGPGRMIYMGEKRQGGGGWTGVNVEFNFSTESKSYIYLYIFKLVLAKQIRL